MFLMVQDKFEIFGWIDWQSSLKQINLIGKQPVSSLNICLIFHGTCYGIKWNYLPQVVTWKLILFILSTVKFHLLVITNKNDEMELQKPLILIQLKVSLKNYQWMKYQIISVLLYSKLMFISYIFHHVY